MIGLRDLPLRRKLGLILWAVVLPLLAAELLAVGFFRRSLQSAAALELTNVVNHLYRVCDFERRVRPCEEAAAAPRPTPSDIRFLEAVFHTVKVGSTGYAYAMNSRGTLLIHPSKQGQNIFDSRDSKGFPFIRAICDEAVRLGPEAVGTIRYPWTNEEAGDTTPRMKILKFRYFRRWDWIVAAGSYEEEVFGAVGRLGLYTAPLVLGSVLLVFALTWGTGRVLTRPLLLLAEAARRMAAGDLDARVELRPGGDELSALGRSFNAMAEQVREKTQEMERLIHERTQALADSRERYRSLVQSTVDGIVTTDLHGEITWVNRGLEVMLGYGRDDMVGREIWGYYPAGKEQARRIMRLLREQGNLTNFEMEMIGRDRVVPIRTSASILRDSTGREQGTLGIFSDTSAERKLKADLRQTQARLIQTMKLRALGDLVSGVAHEINNPLMASTTTLYLMEQAECPAGCPNRSRLGILQRCNERVSKIVDHLKEFSRETSLELRELDPLLPLENALLLSGQQLLNRGIEVEKDLAPDLPRILGDANALEQVFLNLIANARDALEGVEGPRRVTFAASASELGGRPAVALDVTDTGPGVPPGLRGKIFEPFFTTKEAGQGTGLGLSISYGIVEQHGGRIEVSNGPEGGACFRVLLPVRPSSNATV
ncbi:MAG: Cache 3/Cache 2 fusion domain-containing protein [Deltaproteobacteria bacterium]|nr:Cache 3/Cache 2 fusion domain-containing protein [Deltaproteobacteria bacterium]